MNRSKLPPNSPLSTPISNLAVLHVPFEGLRRDVSAGNTGASLIGEQKQVVSPLLTWSAAVQAGSTVLEGLRENVSLAAVVKLPEPTWQPESGFALEADPVFGSVLLGPPRRVCGLVRVSRQLLVSAPPGLDQLLIDDLSRACSSQLDRIVFYGDPVANANQPRGIANTPLIHRIDTGVVIPAWEDFCEAERLIEDEDVGLANFAFVTQPDLKAELRRRPQWGDGGGLSVWDALPRVKSAMADIGEATLNAERFGREKVLAFRPWLLDSGEVTPRDDPLILAQLRKFIQIYSGLDLISGDLFVCPYSALKGLYCAVEGFPGDERAPIEICQA